MDGGLHGIDSHKLHLHPERVAQWRAAGSDWELQKKVYPLYVEISPVGHCNQRCVFCAVDYIGYKPKTIATGVLTRGLRAMAECGVKSVMFAGEGEPLLHKELGQIINFAKSVGLDTAITTNATQLTDEFIRECLRSVTWLKASVNGGDRNTYALVHQTKPEDFEKVFSNLQNAVFYRDRFAWKTTLGAQAVLLPENLESLVGLCQRAKAIGLDYVVIKPYSQHLKSTETAKRGYDRQHYDLVDLRMQLAALNNQRFRVIFRDSAITTSHESARRYPKCLATPNFWAYIMATGEVYGCSAYLLDQRFCYGNLNEQSFPEIWEGERRRQSAAYVAHELSIHDCRKNCRMEQVNQYLWALQNPEAHANFI